MNAFALLYNQIKTNSNANKIKLLIAGKPLVTQAEYLTSLEKLSVNLGIQNDVTFLGYVSNTTNVYQVSDVTV